MRIGCVTIMVRFAIVLVVRIAGFSRTVVTVFCRMVVAVADRKALGAQHHRQSRINQKRQDNPNDGDFVSRALVCFLHMFVSCRRIAVVQKWLDGTMSSLKRGPAVRGIRLAVGETGSIIMTG